MRKLFLASAALIAASAFMTVGSVPASAGAFCSTYPEGGQRSCGYSTYGQCARSIQGAGGQCEANANFGGYEDDSYAYAPGPAYGPSIGYGYDNGPRYRRPGFGVYIGGY